jgi:hypothetical protein
MALAEIRGPRLYHEKLETFEDYFRGRWELSVRHSQRLMLSAGVMDSLRTRSVGRLPSSERQARPLTQPETAEAQQEAWETAVETAPEGRF